MLLREFTVNALGTEAVEGDQFQSNTIRTNKYTVLTFLPLNLMLQFSKVANVYFLFVAVLTYFTGTFMDAFLSILPLLLVVTVSMVKDIIEDRVRYLSD